MNIFPFKKNKKSRGIRDENGHSLRQRAFELFDNGLRPMQVCQQILIKRLTCLRYWQDWKKSPPNLSQRYKFLRKVLKNDTGFREEIIEQLADYYKISRDEVIRRFEEPYGSKHLLMGKWPTLWPDDGSSEAEARLRAALTLIDIFETRSQSSYQEINDALNKLLARSRNKKQPELTGEGDREDNSQFQELAGRYSWGFSTHRKLVNLTPEQEAYFEKYFIQKQAEENFKAYNDLISLMGMFGFSKEKADELFWQAVGKSQGPEKTEKFHQQIKDMKDSFKNKYNDK